MTWNVTGQCMLMFVVLISLLLTFYMAGQRNGPFSQLSAEILDDGGFMEDGKETERFITASVNQSNCGGLANRIWRTVSMLCVGKKVGRQLYFSHPLPCQKHWKEEATELFPKLEKRFLILDPIPNETVVDFASAATIYEDPLANAALLGAKEKYVRITGNYLQHQLYLADDVEEVLELLGFSPETLAKVERVKEGLFRLVICNELDYIHVATPLFYGSDGLDHDMRIPFTDDSDSHKLCVHTRRTDFGGFNGESEAPFTEVAVNRVRSALLGRYAAVSMVVFGDDPEFVRSLNFSATRLRNVYHLSDGGMSRGEDLCFAATYCDSLLITAQGSTFAWWMGYLMMGRKQSSDGAARLILYRADMKHDVRGQYHREHFPPAWIPLLPLDREILLQDDEGE